MSDYICSLCKQPAKPKLEHVGVVADCPNGCVEAPLLVWDNGDDCCKCLDCGVYHNAPPRHRPVTEQEERDLADQIEDDQKWDAVESKL